MQESKQMTRRKCAWLVLALSACRERTPLPADLFPQTLGAWRRTGQRDLPISEAPDPVPRSNSGPARSATYEGPGRLEVRVYAMDSIDAGLALAQRWRPSADTVFFNQGRYFVVVKWQQADRQALREFVREMEKRLAPKR